MTDIRLPDALVRSNAETRIALVVLDGLGGLPAPGHGQTELEAARTPVLDDLAGSASLGMLQPVAPGVTPGSGPGHLALFGYDPVAHPVGRGALSALGVGFPLEPGDLAVRLNLATLDGEGRVRDRRAGRPPDEEGRRVVETLEAGLRPPDGVELHLGHEKEHRAVLILRGEAFGDRLQETDPQTTGVPPLEPEPLDEASRTSGRVLGEVLNQARDLLADEPVINGVLARGYAAHQGFPSLQERFGLQGAAVASYPMYRGVARLVGMEATGEPASDPEAVEVLQDVWEAGRHDFHFLHFKGPDARGEDGDFDAKVAAIEGADALLSAVRHLEPDVLVVTGDHATPASYGAHSWHTVPVLLASRWARPTGDAFGETVCRQGDLGTLEARHLMSLMLAHAGRLEKFGA